MDAIESQTIAARLQLLDALLYELGEAGVSFDCLDDDALAAWKLRMATLEEIWPPQHVIASRNCPIDISALTRLVLGQA